MFIKTNRCTYPNVFQKMKYKLIMQVFSHSVSSVMKTCVQTGQLKSKTLIYAIYYNKSYC